MSGETVSYYKILEKRGEGEMSVVYKTQDTSPNRLVALKFLPTYLVTDEDGQLYICMAYYEGESLREKIDRSPIPFNEAIKICSQIAMGLKAAHEQNIIHRDIKPGNILVTDNGDVKIIDFGLAELAVWN